MDTAQSTMISGWAAGRAARPLLLGHRGTTIYAPENTFQAFDRALGDGCDGIEFDVRVTSDSHAIVCHDPSYARREVAESTLDSLLQLGAQFPGLADVLRNYAHRCFLYIELKAPGAESELVSVLKQCPPVH